MFTNLVEAPWIYDDKLWAKIGLKSKKLKRFSNNKHSFLKVEC